MNRFTDQELLNLSALDQARAIRQGNVSSIYLTNLYLSRIRKYNNSLQAFVNIRARQGRKAAKQADRLRSQHYHFLLHLRTRRLSRRVIVRVSRMHRIRAVGVLGAAARRLREELV